MSLQTMLCEHGINTNIERCERCATRYVPIYTVPRHPANVALDAWLRTDEGMQCAEGRAQGQYMQNRLYWAFMAGWNACESQSDRGADVVP